MENKQDRKLPSLKKDPDEDVGSNHDRKPASLKKDPDEDVVILNNHYDSTDMEEEDDYDELDELPLLDCFCIGRPEFLPQFLVLLLQLFKSCSG
jgi:hypothetical protein